jgi:hypothetical protein
MTQLSIRIPGHLHQRLLAKKEEESDENVSDTVRKLLFWALENQSPVITKAEIKILLQRSISYSIMIHSILEECLETLVRDGAVLEDKAHAKAEKIIADLVEKFPSNAA